MSLQHDSRRRFLGQVATGLAGTLATVPVLGASDRVRLGVIGAGDRGTELVHQVRACTNADVVAFADIYNKRLEKAAGLAPAAALYSDYRQLLDDSSIDAVLIATPTHLHADQFCDALAAGKHVYIEKTLALTLDQAKRMRAAYLNDSGRHAVQVGHQACSSGHAADVSRFLADPSYIGQVTALAMRHHRNTPAGKPQWARPNLLTSDVNARNVAWEQFAGEAPFDAHRYIHWRYFWDYSGGAITENMSQQLAFWYQALNLQIPALVNMSGGVYLPQNGQAGRETPDTINVSLEQSEQMLITWSAGHGNQQLGAGEDLLGANGTVSRNNQVRYIPQKMTRPDAPEMQGRSASAPHAHMSNFLDAIRFGTPTHCPFELGYRVAVACMMAIESYRQVRTVRWDSASEQIV